MGELVEEARAIMSTRNEIGDIQPEHLRQAFHKLKASGKLDFESMNLKKVFS